MAKLSDNVFGMAKSDAELKIAHEYLFSAVLPAPTLGSFTGLGLIALNGLQLPLDGDLDSNLGTLQATCTGACQQLPRNNIGQAVHGTNAKPGNQNVTRLGPKS